MKRRCRRQTFSSGSRHQLALSGEGDECHLDRQPHGPIQPHRPVQPDRYDQRLAGPRLDHERLRPGHPSLRRQGCAEHAAAGTDPHADANTDANTDTDSRTAAADHAGARTGAHYAAQEKAHQAGEAAQGGYTTEEGDRSQDRSRCPHQPQTADLPREAGKEEMIDAAAERRWTPDGRIQRRSARIARRAARIGPPLLFGGSPGTAQGTRTFAHFGCHLSTGDFAALTSSSRLTGVVCGALCRNSGSSVEIWRRARANASRVSRLSVSVGSIIRASETMRGKYTVGEWKLKSMSRLPMSMARMPRSLARVRAEATNSCMQRVPKGTGYTSLIRASR